VIAALDESPLGTEADGQHALARGVRNPGEEQRRAELTLEITATQSVIERVAGCGIELYRRGRKLAVLVHADHDAVRALLLEASSLYDEVHERVMRLDIAHRRP